MEKKIRMPLAPVFLIITCILNVINNFIFHKPSFFTILCLIVDLALCYALFTKRRDVVLVGILGVNILLSSSFASVPGILYFASDAFILVFALSVCERPLINLNLDKFKAFAEKFFYLPAALCFVASIFSFFLSNLHSYYVPFGIKALFLILRILGIAIAFFLALWLKDPYEKMHLSKRRKLPPMPKKISVKDIAPLVNTFFCVCSPLEFGP